MARKTDKAYDWRQYPKKEWPYKGDVKEPQYLKDRAELFADNKSELAPFNGWWWYVPNKIHKIINKYQKIKRKKRKKNDK